MSAVAVLGLAWSLSACGLFHTFSPTPQFEEVGGCTHENILPILELTEAHKQLLGRRADPPRTALDYYLALPDTFFGNVEDTTPERRVSFIDLETLSDQWLKARHFFECDGGGFEVVMRIFETEDGPLVAIDEWSRRLEKIHEVENAPRGELSSISLGVPSFLRYREGGWEKATDVSLPVIGKDRVVERYREHYRAHLNRPDQPKFMWLHYELPPAGSEIRLTGRENFMDPGGEYLWQVLKFDGRGFVEVPLAD